MKEYEWDIKRSTRGHKIDLDRDNVIYYFEPYFPKEVAERLGGAYQRCYERAINLKNMKNIKYSKSWNYNNTNPYRFVNILNIRFRELNEDPDVDEWLVCVIPGSQQVGEKANLNSMSQLLKKAKYGDKFKPQIFLIERTEEVNSKHLSSDRRTIEDDYNTMRLTEDISGKNILVLDDIVTTGDSFTAVKNLLLDHGAKKVACVAMAKTYSGYKK